MTNDEIDALDVLVGLMHNLIELNPSNYDHDQVCQLNTDAGEIADIGLDLLPRAITALETLRRERDEAVEFIGQTIIAQPELPQHWFDGARALITRIEGKDT